MLSVLPVGVVALLCVAFVGCTADDAPSGGPDKIRIGVSLLTQQHDFYQDLQEGLEKSAKHHNYALSIQSGEFDAAEQAKQLQTFVTQKVDAIVVCPCDSAGVAQAIQRANDAKIPVFTADISAEGGEVVSHIASDNVQGGRLAAETLVRFMGESGEVIVIDHPEVASVQERVRGFEEVIAKY
ncbi:MAG: substrate-binding domain-containing protein, partial [Planctomycetota bacterium]